MLLPALSKARDKARSISCINNLKTLDTYVQMYLAESPSYTIYDINNERSGNNWHGQYWIKFINKYAGIVTNPDGKKDDTNTAYSLTLVGGKVTPSFWKCPGRAESASNYGWTDLYAANGAVLQAPWGNSGQQHYYFLKGNVLKTKNPAETMMMADGTNGSEMFYSDNWSCDIAQAHNGKDGVNMAFWDGHCGSFSYRVLKGTSSIGNSGQCFRDDYGMTWIYK
jgi:prepilin-type processing-associated H-X9-DG protein